MRPEEPVNVSEEDASVRSGTAAGSSDAGPWGGQAGRDMLHESADAGRAERKDEDSFNACKSTA